MWNKRRKGKLVACLLSRLDSRRELMRWLYSGEPTTVKHINSIHHWLQFILSSCSVSETTAIKYPLQHRSSLSRVFNGLINSMCVSFTNDCTSLMNTHCHWCKRERSKTHSTFHSSRTDSECLIIIEVRATYGGDIDGIKFPPLKLNEIFVTHLN